MSTPSFRVDGLNALVTGAAAGIGSAIAIALAESGAVVACHGNRRPALETCNSIASLGGRSLSLEGDLEQRETAERLSSRVVAELGCIDLLVNCAGMIRRAPAVEFREEDWASVIEVNLSSVFRLCQAAGQRMLSAGRGKIVNIASLLAFQGGISVPAYAAS